MEKEQKQMTIVHGRSWFPEWETAGVYPLKADITKVYADGFGTQKCYLLDDIAAQEAQRLIRENVDREDIYDIMERLQKETEEREKNHE